MGMRSISISKENEELYENFVKKCQAQNITTSAGLMQLIRESSISDKTITAIDSKLTEIKILIESLPEETAPPVKEYTGKYKLGNSCYTAEQLKTGGWSPKAIGELPHETI